MQGIADCALLPHMACMLMMNRGRAAKLFYAANGFRILSSGDHVLCAVSGEQIPLDELRYWSVARQEPYASAQISSQAALSTR
jgi:hypothetical protein